MKIPNFIVDHDPSTSADTDWEPLRLALLQRSLWLLLPITSAYVLLTAFLGHPLLPSVAGVGFAVLVLLMVQHRPDARRLLTWGLGLATLALLGLSASLWHGPAPAPALTIAALIGTLGLMLDGARLGSTLFLGGLCLHGYTMQRLPSDDHGGSLALGLLLGTSLGLFVSALSWYRALGRGQAELRQASRLLRAQQAERQALSLALFEQLSQAQAALQSALEAGPSVDWAAIGQRAEQMQAQAAQVRGLHSSFKPVESARGLDRHEFSRGIIGVILGISAFLALAGWVSYFGHGQGQAWHGPFALGVLAACAFSLRRGRPVPAGLAWTVVLLGPLILLADQAAQWRSGLAASSSFWMLSILYAGLLLGLRPALAMTALGIAASLAALGATPQATALQWQSGLTLMLAFGMAGTICLQAVAWKQNLLAQLDEGRRRLALSLAQRRRLLGTLFHDVANPLAAVLGLAAQARAGLEAPDDLDRARRLGRRLGELLQGGRTWLLSEGISDSEHLGPVELAPVLGGMADLFKERLAAKRLGLSVDLDPGLRALARTATLRDSVLGNLMSNAIKFSRPGSSLELEARREDAGVWIELRDRGPGIDPALLQGLQSGADLPSRSGTDGEEGQGLGLALACEHVQRMGGRLEVQPRAGGGTVARVRLKSA
jgi:signal transduction histidine kinase